MVSGWRPPPRLGGHGDAENPRGWAPIFVLDHSPVDSENCYYVSLSCHLRRLEKERGLWRKGNCGGPKRPKSRKPTRITKDENLRLQGVADQGRPVDGALGEEGLIGRRDLSGPLDWPAARRRSAQRRLAPSACDDCAWPDFGRSSRAKRASARRATPRKNRPSSSAAAL